MRNTFCLLAVLALIACTREADLPQEKGFLSVRLSADLAVTPVVKAEAGEPDPAFALQIVPAGGGETIRVADYRTLAAPMTLPAGDYTVKAVSGPDTRQSWEAPRYEAETQVTVRPDRLTEASLTATLARTMVTVEFVRVPGVRCQRKRRRTGFQHRKRQSLQKGISGGIGPGMGPVYGEYPGHALPGGTGLD